jgi:para-nitrobenzyl esterase
MKPALALIAALFPLAAHAQPVAGIDTGKLAGATAAGVDSFKGIPFAAPPVGDLRWRAPQPAAPWTGTRDATAYANDCAQLPFPSDAAPLGTPPSEDCLYANVWRPARHARKLPVLVWIYGGGFVNGGSSPPTYSGAELAKQGILFVSFNYRLGRFGTFAHPALSKADPDHGQLANYGYMDQVAALNWIHRNIAAFGGDPANVTIIGESAGGMSVHTLVTSPATHGLFQRAVVQSGGDGANHDATVATAEQAGLAFAAANGIAADDPQAMARLRALPMDTVIGGINLASFNKDMDSRSRPVVDGRIAVEPIIAYTSGAWPRIPMMIGATSDDIGGPTGYMTKGARDLSALLAGQKAPVWYYRFSYVADSLQTPETRGASHASDIPFFFHTEGINYGPATTARDRRAGATISRYLLNFVKTGDPNGAGLPRWGKATGASGPMLDLTADGDAAVGPDPWAPQP